MTQRRKSSLHRPLQERLSQRGPRSMERAKSAFIHSLTHGAPLHSSHQLAASIVGLLVLRSVEEHGRTRLHEQAIDDAITRLSAELTAEEMMRLEVEAYEILDWLLGDEHPIQSDPEIARVEEDGVVLYDPEAKTIALLREAIFQSFDLKIDYFSRRRGEMNTRVITPIAIGADTYLRAWCHSRRDERIFRLDRIRRALPVNGRPSRTPEVTTNDADETSLQGSLFDFDT